MTTLIDIPTVTTDRLTMRGAKHSDFEAYAAFCAGLRSERIGGPFSRSASWDSFLACAGHWQIRGYGQWFVEENISGEPVGWIGFYNPDRYEEPELSWTLFDAFEGKSYAYEAALAARNYGQTHFDLTSVVSFIETANHRSIALAERLGATLQETRDNGDGPFHIYRHLAPEAMQ